MALSTFILAGGAIAATVAALPYALPGSATVERSAIIDASPEEIFPLLASNRGFQKINPYLDADPKLKIAFSGPDYGVGSTFAFDGKDGKGTQTITAMEENRSVTNLIDLGSMGQPVQTFTLTPVEGGTKVVWSTTSEFGMNPIGRVIGLFMDGFLGKTYEKGLTNISNAVTAA
ncbi:MAG: SRPBCC family protein [Pseudomonadota bacterium]